MPLGGQALGVSMLWESFFLGVGAGIVLMAFLGCWMFDWFARGLEFEDMEDDE